MRIIPRAFVFLATCALLLSCSGAGRTLVLQNEQLTVSFDIASAALRVEDMRSGKVWSQAPGEVKVLSASKKGGRIVAKLEGSIPFGLEIGLDGASLACTLSADPEIPVDTLSYPAPFVVESDDFYVLETDGEGMLLPVTNLEYPRGEGITYFCGGGLTMAWKGMMDKDMEAGYQIVLGTPYDACITTFVQADNRLSIKPVWLPNMQKWGYDREVTYNFFDKGGYVAQSKKYRDYVWDKNGIVSLKSQSAEFPAINGIVGSTTLMVWDTGRDVSVLKEMKELGIERLFVQWDANHPPYPMVGYDNEVRALGYVSGGYELFTDLHKRDTTTYEFDYNGPVRHRHCVYPGKYEALAARKADGGTYSNQFGTYACPSAMLPYITAKIDRKLAEYPHDALFFDVYQANGLYECYSEEHPIDRRGYAENIINNIKTVRDRYHVVMGSEWGAEFAIPYSIYNQGMMTLQRPWWASEMMVKGTEYYYGSWDNPSRPSIMVTTCKAGPTYYKYCINEAIRVPLYQLVYHDAVVSTWRWEDGNSRYPELWWKKDLFNMLYGTSPLWSIDRTLWETYRSTFVESSKMVTPWIESVGFDEMLDHRFLTADGSVQMSTFSSGKAIAVNFGEEEFAYNDVIIEPRSYVEFAADDTGRLAPVCGSADVQ